MKKGIAVHGGAGTIDKNQLTPELEIKYKKGLEDALLAGYRVLNEGGNSLEAVEQAVVSLENNELFNAGKGSVFNHEGKHEMDASIMEGSQLRCGAVAGVRLLKNPITLARMVLEKSEHVLLAGKGAEDFAKEQSAIFETEEYFYSKLRYEQLLYSKEKNTTQLDHSVDKDKKFGTVGAVAIDSYGTVSAATSTGGMTNKKFGRIGDSPVIGAGTYANNKTCAVSCTGHGEFFIKSVVAYDVSCLMEYQGLSLQEACVLVVQNKLKEIGGEGGLIAVDRHGNICLEFNSQGMYRAKISDGEELFVSIF